MQVPDHETGAPGAAAAALGVHPLMDALRDLYRAYQKSAMYPSGHPSIPTALQQSARSLERALADRPSLLVGVARDHLLLDHEQMPETQGTIRALAKVLHGLDVAAVGFESGVTENELLAFVEVLTRARNDDLRGESLRIALQGRNVARLQIVPMDYRALSFGSGEGGPDDVWESLTRLLTAGDELDDVSPEAIADHVDGRISRLEGTGAAELRGRVHRIVEKMELMEPDARDDVRQHLGKFVSALSPGLRQDLLRVDPYRPDASINLLHELVEELPAPELLEALEDVDRAKGRTPEGLLILMNKLVRICHGKPAVENKLHETLERWGVPQNALSGGEDSLRSSLEEMFQRRVSEDFNPEDYQGMLDDLSRRNLEGAAVASAANYRNPLNPLDVRLHAAELAVLLLNRRDGEEHRTGLFAYVGAQTDMLLDHAKFTLVHEAANAARMDSLLATDLEHTREAAARYLADFKGDQRIDRVLQLAFSGKTIARDAVSLLRLGGDAALERALDLLVTSPPKDLEDALCRFLLEGGAKRIAGLIEARAHRSWTAVKPLFRIIAELPPKDAHPLLETLSNHDEFGVRRDAVLALCAHQDDPALQIQQLKRALNDPNPWVVSTALQHMAKLGPEEASQWTARFLEGRLACGRPLTEPALRATDALLNCEGNDLSELCRVLIALGRSLRSTDAALGTVLAERLAKRRADPVVAATLKKWKRSPARLFGLIRGKHGDDQ